MPSPLKERIYRELLDKIRTGELRTGQRISSEKDLQRFYQVSRSPVREALARLASEGVISRQPGRGTYVCNVDRGSPIATLSSFMYYFKTYRNDISSKTLSVEVKRPPRHIAGMLQASMDQTVTHIRRVRLFKGEPVIYLKDILAPRFPPEPFKKNPSFLSMTRFMRETFHVFCTHAKEEVDAIIPSLKEQEIIHMKKAEPVLQVKRISYDIQGDCIIYARYIVKSTTWKYRTSLFVSQCADWT